MKNNKCRNTLYPKFSRQLRMLIHINPNHHDFSRPSLGKALHHRMHHMARGACRREKIYQNRELRILEKVGSLACRKLKDTPWLWKGVFTTAADNLFPAKTQRIVVSGSAVRAAHLHLLRQKFLLLGQTCKT